MQRESRSNYIVRKMREDRIDNRRFEDSDTLILSQENAMLRNNVKELQEHLQNAYKRIIELTYDNHPALNVKNVQLELFE